MTEGNYRIVSGSHRPGDGIDRSVMGAWRTRNVSEVRRVDADERSERRGK